MSTITIEDVGRNAAVDAISSICMNHNSSGEYNNNNTSDGLVQQHQNGNNVDDDDDDDDCQYIFPQRLMSILMKEKNHDAICWLPHGKGFVIRNRKLFAEKIMPRFFPRKSKYSSFTRKLNRWNFVRVSSGQEHGAYYHEFFLRDKPHLAAQMFCKNARTMIALASDFKGTTAYEPMAAVRKEIPSVAPLQQQQWQAENQQRHSLQNVAKSADAATELFMLGHQQQHDPALQFLLSQSVGPPRVPSQLDVQTFFRPQQEQQQQLKQQAVSFLDQQQQQPKLRQQQSQILAYGDPVPSATAMTTTASSTPCAMPAINGTSIAAAGSSSSMNNIWQQIQAHKKQEAQMVQLRQMMAFNLQQQRQQQQNRSTSSAKNFRASAA